MISPEVVRCAIYTRKSSEEGLEQSFNSLHAQREACEAYVASQRHEGWRLKPEAYDDGGFSGGSMERPALRQLLADIAAKRIDTVVVYKVDRLTRSLADFAKIVEQFDKQGISFVSVTQQFNTTTSMGRLTLNVLLSFAQFEREVTGERIRDKIAASKRKGMWMGGVVPVGYRLENRQLIVDPTEAEHVREVYRLYLELGCVSKLQAYLDQAGCRSKKRLSGTGRSSGGVVYSRGALYDMLHNRIYLGEITHKDACFPGLQAAIVDRKLWDQVQAQFQANLQALRSGGRRRKTKQSLLTGLLYDEQGNRFTPSHTNKKGRRYRYYTSQAAIREPGKRHARPVRYPAEEVEEVVVSQLKALLESPERLVEILRRDSDEATDLENLEQGTREWASTSTDRVQPALPSIVTKIVLGEKRLELSVSRRTLRGLITGDLSTATYSSDSADHHDEEDIYTIDIESELRRCGGEMRLLLLPGNSSERAHSAPALICAIAQAHDWIEQVLNGKTENQRSIAKSTGLNERYVSKLIPLAFLAPDIVEAVLEGKQPSHFTIDYCARQIPTSWEDQRRLMMVQS